MNKIDIIRTMSETTDPVKAAEHLADGFKRTDAGGNPPMDKASWIGMGQLMRASIPDLKFEIEDVHEEGDKLKITSRFMGTFQNDMDLTAMGFGKISATGRPIKFQSNSSLITFDGDKIKEWHDTAAQSLADFVQQFTA